MHNAEKVNKGLKKLRSKNEMGLKKKIGEKWCVHPPTKVMRASVLEWKKRARSGKPFSSFSPNNFPRSSRDENDELEDERKL